MNYRYPKSFPDYTESNFLDMLFAPNELFLEKFETWKNEFDFNNTPIAISRLIPNLYRRLAQYPYDQVGNINKIKGIYKLAWYKNQLLTRDLAYILNVLKEASVPCILLKGSVLLAENNLTENKEDINIPFARFQNDIDILIPQESVLQIITLFKKDGWHYTDPNFVFKENLPLEKLLKTTKEVTFSKPGFTEIDFHWHITDSSHEPAFTNSVWKSSLPASLTHSSLLNVQCRIPCPEDFILHCIIHGASKNSIRPIRWIADTLETIKLQLDNNHKIDWDYLFNQSITHGFKAELYFALMYLNEHFSYFFPAHFSKQINTLSPTPSEVRSYFSKTDTLQVPFLGNFIELWNGYWNHENKESLLEYFRKKWHLNHVYDIPLFIIKKYWNRLINSLRRIGFFINVSKK